jgi:hypothetical protein
MRLLQVALLASVLFPGSDLRASEASFSATIDDILFRATAAFAQVEYCPQRRNCLVVAGVAPSQEVILLQVVDDPPVAEGAYALGTISPVGPELDRGEAAYDDGQLLDQTRHGTEVGIVHVSSIDRSPTGGRVEGDFWFDAVHWSQGNEEVVRVRSGTFSVPWTSTPLEARTWANMKSLYR